MIPRKRLKLSFESFLKRFPYDIWFTATFDKTVSTTMAKKRFKYFLKHLNSSRTVFYQKYVYVWVFFEKNKSRKGVHIHALINGIEASKASLLETFASLHFGESKVIAGHQNVIPYVAEKYDSADLDDFDYLKINSRFRKSNRTQQKTHTGTFA